MLESRTDSRAASFSVSGFGQCEVGIQYIWETQETGETTFQNLRRQGKKQNLYLFQSHKSFSVGYAVGVLKSAGIIPGEVKQTQVYPVGLGGMIS